LNDYPYETLAHNPDHHEEIHSKYKEVYDSLNHAMSNPESALYTVKGTLTPIAKTSEGFANEIEGNVNATLQDLCKNLPQITSGLYGDHDSSVYGKAIFLDRFNAITKPETVLNHMGNGTATANQVYTLRGNMPSVWQQFQQNTLNDVITSEEQGPEYRLAVYGYTGIETHPNVSSAALMQKAQAQMVAAQQQGAQQDQAPQSSKAQKNPSTKPPSDPMSSLVAAPYNSPQGRLP